MSSSPRVLITRSLSFSGTTWLSLVAGTPSNFAAIGPPDLLWKAWLSGKAPNHKIFSREAQELTDKLLQTTGKMGTFVELLTELVGRPILIVDNPSKEFEVAELKSIDNREIIYFRDVRSVMRSYSRLNPTSKISDQLGRDSWFLPTLKSLVGAAERGIPVLGLQSVSSQPDLLALSLGAIFDGMDVQVTPRYWLRPTYMAGGNAGPLSLVAYHQGLMTGLDPRYLALYQNSSIGSYRPFDDTLPSEVQRWGLKDSFKYRREARGLSERMNRFADEYRARLAG